MKDKRNVKVLRFFHIARVDSEMPSPAGSMRMRLMELEGHRDTSFARLPDGSLKPLYFTTHGHDTIELPQPREGEKFIVDYTELKRVTI